ncbi:hypothetical protein JXL21_07490 [Candidatus Bathyarchaeota archaeon]|nr:hypothetical protein [Candidatus Bathyarchaeota archaeon]
MIELTAVDAWEKEQKQEAVETLQEQLKIEGELVSLYEEYERGTENNALKRMMQMFRLDSQRHINILQAAIEIIEGEDVFIEDKQDLKESLKKHLELEAEALKKANQLLGRQWINETQGLKQLLEMWRNDEKRHHAALKELSQRTYFQLNSNDFVQMFRGEDFLEERYRRAKAFKEKKRQDNP